MIPLAEEAKVTTRKTAQPKATEEQRERSGSKRTKQLDVAPLVHMLRAIKDATGLTARQFQVAMLDYENKNAARVLTICEEEGVQFSPVTHKSINAYLDGWVNQKSYNKAFLRRATEFFETYTASRKIVNADMRDIMEGWFRKVGINYRDSSVSPTRALAAIIAPYYLRPVLAKASGTFKLLPVKQSDPYFQPYSIEVTPKATNGLTTKDAIKVKTLILDDLSPLHPLLVEDGQEVEFGQILQHSLLMVRNSATGEVSPSKDHVTLFRWYSQNKRPRSSMQIEAIDSAIEQYLKAKAESKAH
jgi:hypothetical protein